MPSYSPIRLALIGAGIFARDAHLPALTALGDTFEIVAVCSRTRESANRLAALIPHPVEVYTRVAEVLARQDVEAVDVTLPIDVMPEVVEQALRAGKHVISEKPVSPDVATGRRLAGQYAARPAGQVWMVAENFRYEAAYVRAAEVLRSGEIGRPIQFHWPNVAGMNAENKYYHTAWRRSGTWPGGFLLDGGVHQIAALRLLLGEITEVAAFAAQVRPDLPPADTLSAALRFASGVSGVYSVTYAAEAGLPIPLRIVGDRGALTTSNGELQLWVGGETRSIEVEANRGIEGELAAFAAAIREGRPHANSPLEALRDVAVIEALLRAAETGQIVAPERIL